MTNEALTKEELESILSQPHDMSRDSGTAARKLIPGRFYYLFENGGAPETIQFVGEELNKDAELERTFIGYDGRDTAGQRAYMWRAYRYNGRWCLGSGATPFTVHLILTDEEIDANARAAQRAATMNTIALNEKRLARLRQEIEEVEAHITELKNTL